MRDLKISTPTCLLLSFLAACGSPPPAATTPSPDPEALLGEEETGAQAEASSGKVQEGIDAIAAGDFEKAKGILEAAAEADAKDPQAAFYLGVALGGLQDNEAAIASFKRALSLQPKFPEASLNLSALLLDVGQPQDALAVANQGLEAAPEDAALLQNKAMALLDSGDFPGAAEAFKNAVEKSPDNQELRFLYGQSLVAAERNQDAIAALAPLKTSDKLEVLASVADLYGRLKAWDDCVVALDKALALKDASELHVKRGLCLHGKQDEKGAKTAFETAIARDPKSAKAYFYLGHNLKSRKDKAGAKAAFEKAASLGDDKLAAAARAALKKL